MVITNESPQLDGWNFVIYTKLYTQMLYFFIYVDNHEHGQCQNSWLPLEN